MKILYTTDLHGRLSAYETVLERSVEARAAAIVNGGDIGPLGRDLFAVQCDFLGGYFADYLGRCRKAGLAYLATLGNMDLRGLDNRFRRVMSSAGEAFSLLEASATFAGWTFIGSAMTTDGPFSLKDRCRRDTENSPAPVTTGAALVSDSTGLHKVEDWPGQVRALPSLAEHLRCLPVPPDPRKTIYVLHQPPFGAGQGIISSGADAGSRAVAEFLMNCSAPLSLHGHIHESPFAGGQWRAALGRTTCVQPGQLGGDGCVTVLIDLESLEMEHRC